MRWMIRDDTSGEWDKNMLNLEENLEDKFYRINLEDKNYYNNLEKEEVEEFYGKWRSGPYT